VEDYTFASVVNPVETVVAGLTGRWRLIRVGDEWPDAKTVTRALRRADKRVEHELFESSREGTYGGDPFSWVDRSLYVWEQLQRQHPEWFIVVREDYAT
jgi:hypothetical protein